MTQRSKYYELETQESLARKYNHICSCEIAVRIVQIHFLTTNSLIKLPNKYKKNPKALEDLSVEGLIVKGLFVAAYNS